MPRRKIHQQVKQQADPPYSGSLPSRSEVQRKKKKKVRKKRKTAFPLIKILAAFFILMPTVVIIFMDFFEKNTLPLIKEISNSGYETVNVIRHSPASDHPNLEEVQEVPGQLLTATDEKKSEISEEQKIVGDKMKGIKQSEHVVVPGDTLFNIAITYYHSSEGMKIIREWNNLNGDEIQLGQKLKVPVKK